MKKLKIILIWPALFLVDCGIKLFLGGHWKTMRRYSNNKVKQAWNK